MRCTLLALLRALRGQVFVLVAVVSTPCMVKGAELDVLINEENRKSSVEPQCSRLVLPATVLTQDEKYQMALCLKFGMAIAQQMTSALNLLRELALQGHVEAQLALADSLVQGNGAEQREALHWYERCAALGDSRAALRAARLSQRLKAQGDAVEPASSRAWPDFDEPAELPAGYHCHRYGRGQQFCHGGLFN